MGDGSGTSVVSSRSPVGECRAHVSDIESRTFDFVDWLLDVEGHAPEATAIASASTAFVLAALMMASAGSTDGWMLLLVWFVALMLWPLWLMIAAGVAVVAGTVAQRPAAWRDLLRADLSRCDGAGLADAARTVSSTVPGSRDLFGRKTYAAIAAERVARKLARQAQGRGLSGEQLLLVGRDPGLTWRGDAGALVAAVAPLPVDQLDDALQLARMLASASPSLRRSTAAEDVLAAWTSGLCRDEAREALRVLAPSWDGTFATLVAATQAV
jgi:hypothetical protein